MSRYQRLTVITVLATLLLIAVGSTVRTTGSGLGCPDWPLCHGRPLPPPERTAIIEWSHRTTAAIVGLLILVQAIATFRAYRHDRALTALAAISLPLLATEAYLGRITVERELPPAVVAVHLFTALTLIALLGLMAAFAAQGSGRAPIATAERRDFLRVALLATVVTGIVLAIGAYTVATQAGFACTGWPGCPEARIPFVDGTRLQDIHWLHRLTVLAGAGAVAWVFLHVREMREAGPTLRRGAHTLIGLYGLQIIVGAGNIWSGMAEGVRIAHLVVGAAIWTTMVMLAVAGRYRPAAERGRRALGRAETSRAHA